ncbi:MAG: hypothetical protein ACTSRT_21885 [Promethearchaeota archaeon]
MSYKTLQKNLETYFFIHEVNEQITIGLRRATKNDCSQISQLYIAIYGYNYIDPMVYDYSLLAEHLSDQNNIWIAGVNIKNNELVAISLIEIQNSVAISGKTLMKKTYQGLHLSSLLSFNSVKMLINEKLLENCIKIDSDVRANQIGAQKLSESAFGIVYSFIPIKYIFADKRGLTLNNKSLSISEIVLESMFGYFAILPKFLESRVKDVYLLENDLMLFLYKFLYSFRRSMRSMRVVMKDDYLETVKIVPEKISSDIEDMDIKINFYNSFVQIRGLLSRNRIRHLLKKYSIFRIILWKIPTTLEGTYCMDVALDLGFKIVGYDMASIKLRNMHGYCDSIIFFWSNQKIVKADFYNVQTTQKNKALFEKISQQFINE